MAESQDFGAFLPAEIDSIADAVSAPRFGEYVRSASGHRDYALQLYLWNARLSKAFLFPLAMAEVVTRNAIDAGLRTHLGPDWVLTLPFALNAFSQQSYDRARDRLQNATIGPISADSLVAALPFDFWSNLFRQDYALLWQTPGLLGAVFPHLPAGEGRRDVQRRARTVNGLRNRIAHHEPIHDRQDHGATLSVILQLIGLRDPGVREFVRRHSTVTAVVRVPPSRHSRFAGRPLAQANLRPPPELSATDSLDVAAGKLRSARPQVALVARPAGGGYDAVTMSALLGFIADQAALAAGLVDLRDHSVSDVLAGHPVALGAIDIRSSSGDAAARFFPPDKSPPPGILLVTAADGSPAGVIVRPDIRF